MRRSDDRKLEVVKTRLEQYHSLTQPLAQYYQNLNIHCSVDASLPANSVFANLLEIFRGIKSTSNLFLKGFLLNFFVAEFQENLASSS